jgi:hypothetical protein
MSTPENKSKKMTK